MPTGIYKRKSCTSTTKIKIGNANIGKKNGVYKHGMVKTKFYRHWRIMKSRCSDKNRPSYYNKVSVCKEWTDFLKFKEDTHKSYINHVKMFGEANTTLDRIDGNENYHKDNCRWATKELQANNRKNTLFFKLDDKKYTIRDLSKLTGITYKNLFNRLVVHKWLISKAIK